MRASPCFTCLFCFSFSSMDAPLLFSIAGKASFPQQFLLICIIELLWIRLSPVFF